VGELEKFRKQAIGQWLHDVSQGSSMDIWVEVGSAIAGRETSPGVGWEKVIKNIVLYQFKM
jgi:hypothetical protein